MNKKILFSPIGGTDPIKYYRDGSMLHICRHYLPDIVYLYLSHEMLETHKRDNRYVDTIERLGKLLNHSFEVHIIERDDLINVQQYDIFYQDFRDELQKIEKTMDSSDKLLINMASGTPAMKSALLVMATLAEYRFQPIQVSTPGKERNKTYDEQENYEADLTWALNEDNKKGTENRCTEVKCFNLMKLLKIEMIKKHCNSYDYKAALSIAEEIKEDISEDSYRLLQIADARVKLNSKKINKLMEEKAYDIYPIKGGDKQKIFEYALVLKIKIDREEYADFIRGITPVVVDLLEPILEKTCKIKLSHCCTVDKKGVKRWDYEKLESMGLLKVLNKAYENKGGFRGKEVYSIHIINLIIQKSKDSVLNKNLDEIMKIEKEARNMAAHQIVSVTNEWFLKQTGKTASEIYSIIQYLILRAGFNAKKEYWESYDQMNVMISNSFDS